MITKQFQHTTHSIILEIKTIGIIDKTDVIGTLYKQLSNVLTKSANFEELVKAGKIGNLEISIKNYKGNSKTQCIIPTNLDIQNVCLLAAKCEQITKIGHTKGTIQVLDIIHSQKNIEEEIYSRAKELEQQFFSNKDEHKDSKKQKNSIRKSKTNPSKPQIIEIVPNCYTSSSIESSDSIIFVEGRSDIKRLHQFGIYNSLSVNGSHLDILRVKTLPWFNKKTLYLLLDGDSSAKKIALQLKEHFTFEKILYAPKEEEVSSLTKSKLYQLLKKFNIEDTKLLTQQNEEFDYFNKEEYFVIENYLQAISNTNRVVGFDLELGLLFDIEISKFKKTNISNCYILILDALLENSLAKKVKESTHLKCVIARGISTPLHGILTISFEDFKNSVEEE